MEPAPQIGHGSVVVVVVVDVAVVVAVVVVRFRLLLHSPRSKSGKFRRR